MIFTSSLYIFHRMVYYNRDPELIVLDDLTQDNFVMHYTPLNFDSVHVVLDKCAKYHALSMVLANNDQSHLVKNFKGIENKEKLRQLLQRITKGLKNLATAAKKQ